MVKPRIDPDQFDLEQLRETLESPGFAQIARRQEETRLAELAKLATCVSWENARFIQGFLAGIEVAQQIPRILAQEIKARAEQKRKQFHAVDPE